MIQSIQLYQNVKDNTGAATTVKEIVEILSGKVAASSNIEQRILKLRTLKDSIDSNKKSLATTEKGNEGLENYNSEFVKQYEQTKQGLPCVTWSGTFKKRNVKSLLQYSQLICLDIDKLNDEGIFNTAWFKLSTDPRTFILFRSPSGNGIKVVFKTDAAPDQHKDYFLSLEKEFHEKYDIEIDPSGKDICRLCFLSFDTNLYFNPAPVIYTVTPEAGISEVDQTNLSKITTKEKNTLSTTGQQVNDVWDNTQQYFSYTEGNRNNFIFKFACNCNRVGISLTDCEQFSQAAATGLKPDTIKATINSAYKANAHQHATYKRKDTATGGNNLPANNQKSGSNSPAKGTTGNHDSTNAVEPISPDFIFWKEIKTVRGKGDERTESVRYQLSRVDFCNFLSVRGFHLLHTGDEEGFQIVHSRDGIIKTITPQQIKHDSLDWCRTRSLKDVEEMLRTGQTKYFAKNELDSLPYKEVKIKRDTEQQTFFYFQNCFLSVDQKGNIVENDYSKVDGFIWESNKIKFDYKDSMLSIINERDELHAYDDINCEFAKFIAYASYNPNNEDEKHFTRKQVTDRFLSFCTAIGWLLDGYKHPSKLTAIFGIDHKIGERNEANGRTGKSMIPQACERLKKVANISGKNYDPKYQFCDEPITVDSQIINFNDMQRNFDVENIFEKIADPYSVNRRNQGFIHFKYIDSPKIYYSTNFIPKGDGESYKSRMTVIEFSDYFNSGHTPYDEFGHGFFDDSWSNDQWQLFYKFMVWCVALYKEAGLIAYPLPNIEARKLINDVVPEFIDFMEDEEFVPKNVRLVKIKLQETFNEKYFQLYNKKLTAHTFTAWIKKFCTTKGYKINPKQQGKHDKSNSVEYLTIGDDKWNDLARQVKEEEAKRAKES